MEKTAGEKIRDQILKLLREKKIAFEHLIHKKAPNSTIGAEVTKAQLNETIKTLLLKGKKSGKNYLVGILGDQRLNMKKFSLLVKEACEFESLNVLQDKFGLEVGGVTPFLGIFFDLDTYFDEKILNCENVLFGSGLPTESLRIKLKDLISLIHPQIASL